MQFHSFICSKSNYYIFELRNFQCLNKGQTKIIIVQKIAFHVIWDFYGNRKIATRLDSMWWAHTIQFLDILDVSISSSLELGYNMYLKYVLQISLNWSISVLKWKIVQINKIVSAKYFVTFQEFMHVNEKDVTMSPIYSKWEPIRSYSSPQLHAHTK